MRSQAQCQLSAGGVSHRRQAFYIEMESGVLLTYVGVCCADIRESARPASAVIADSAVFDIENCRTRSAQRFAKMSGMREAILGAPEATVNI